MHTIVSRLFGKTTRERVANTISYLLIAACVSLGMQLKWALKSPAPAQWNAYSAQANSHLYDVLNPATPVAMPIVSHRGGIVPGIHEAGTIARLNHNYGQGQRLFELDFSWTSDEQIVVKHDWNERSVIPTREEYLAESPEDHASIEMVYDWLATHPDAFVVTDCKKRSLEGAARIRMDRPELVPQFILQIYQFKDYDLVQSQGFRNVILTLYRCLSEEATTNITEFMETHDLFALTIPKKRADDRDLILAAKELNVPIYAHTVNEAVDLANLLGNGISGVYSDSLTSSGTAVATVTPEARLN
ncbi:Glycerophosphoryl diester phosphodiesterase [Neorhodopirellula lusitana]|uniref:Glycerophosphoryl diester phosphodiesterase n=1 Tax=Neorhodopirellula lusitana TaxID=445327 RepID=A0ABY1PU94_9BACT|nr:hypothetical protein [Neorhodopirellula lusitana]SMP47784.1 Glycerophosphoryl diester phosphodiesterase [Neorhodopirellula lusitana]